MQKLTEEFLAQIQLGAVNAETMTKLGLHVTTLVILAMTIELPVGHGYLTKCIIIEENGITADTCDNSRFLTCKDGRCHCEKPNQIYDYHLVLNKESWCTIKRKRKCYKYERDYACYGRVGSPCVLYLDRIGTVLIRARSLVPESETEREEVTDSNNDLTTSGTTGSLAPTTEQVYSIDSKRLPKCVHNAVCVTKSNLQNSRSFNDFDDNDISIGVCACNTGYSTTATGQCVKTSSAISISVTVPVFSFSLLTFMMKTLIA